MRIKILGTLLLFFLAFLFPFSNTYAIYDPLSVPNNQFGIHLIDSSTEEVAGAQELVNSSKGDWGYVTILIDSNHRSHDKWQKFFDALREKHLIPIVRLATQPQDNYWKLPYNGEEVAWADFLDSLNWPTKNRYVIIYNEPNQGQEWADTVDAASYAKVLYKTIIALKTKNPDFFVLNAGLDASAPNKKPAYEDELAFLNDMEQAVPGIFDLLDGWVSHSYPNPGYVGSPTAIGRATVNNWAWEVEQLKSLGLTKKLPVFITETGWKHAEGQNYDKSLPSSDVVGDNLKKAFQGSWNDPRIVAVTPFLLDYQESPFDHFSFKKINSGIQNVKILGAQTRNDNKNENPDYYPQFQTIKAIDKKVGDPIQESKGQVVSGEIYKSLIAGESYIMPLLIKNTGQSIWGEAGEIKLSPLTSTNNLSVDTLTLPSSTKIRPGDITTFNLKVHATQNGKYHITLGVFNGSKKIDIPGLDFKTEVTAPVSVTVKASLKWKKKPTGNYLFEISSTITESFRQIMLGDNGFSDEIQTKELLPNYAFDFTLKKPFYKPKTVRRVVHSGVNTLDFGELQPDIPSAILHPSELWKILPFSN